MLGPACLLVVTRFLNSFLFFVVLKFGHEGFFFLLYINSSYLRFTDIFIQ
jgi:hypothetical protein